MIGGLYLESWREERPDHAVRFVALQEEYLATESWVDTPVFVHSHYPDPLWSTKKFFCQHTSGYL